MVEIPIIVSTNELTVAGMADTIDLELDLGPQGQRGSKIFSGSGNPNNIPVGSLYFGGYTEFINGDLYISNDGAEIGNVYKYSSFNNEWSLLFNISSITTTFNNTVLFSNGSSSFPSISFIDDDDTGIFHSSLNTIGFSTGGVPRLNISSSGITSILNTTDSSSSITGSLITSGGMGIAKKLYVGTDLDVGNNLRVGGNLTVDGNTTTINSTIVSIDDPIFNLGGDTAPTSDDNKDRGISFRYHTGSVAKLGFFGYDDSTGKLTFIPDATNTSEVFSGTKGSIDAYFSGSDINTGTVSASYIDSAIARLASPTFTGTVTVSNTGRIDVNSSSDAYITINPSTSSNNGYLGFNSDGVSRFYWTLTGASGATMALRAYNDAGSSFTSPLTISRSTGLVTLNNDLNVAGQFYVDTVNKIRVGPQHSQVDGGLTINRDSGNAMIYLSGNGTGVGGIIRGWAASGTAASKTAVAADRILMEIDGRGWGSTTYNLAGLIRISTDTDTSPASYSYADGSMPGKITFLTSTNGTVNAVERMKIDSTGLVTVAGTLKTGTPIVNRNLVINGAMQVHQRGTSTASVSASGYYAADRWHLSLNSGGTWTQTVENDAPTGSGFRKSTKLVIATGGAVASPTGSVYAQFRQLLEGQDLQRFAKGTSSAKQLTLSFWVKTNVSGTYVARLYDVDNGRAVSGMYAIAAGDVGQWKYQTVTFPADTTGAWDNDNNASVEVVFGLMAGPNLQSGTLLTSWGTYSDATTYLGQVNVAAAVGNYWQITGVQLEAGNAATNFEFEPYEATLRKCQRYFVRSPSEHRDARQTGAGAWEMFTYLPVPMRASPNLSLTTPTSGNTILRSLPDAVWYTFTSFSSSSVAMTGLAGVKITLNFAGGLAAASYPGWGTCLRDFDLSAEL